MATRRKTPPRGASRTPADAVLDAGDSTTLLDVLDELLNKGVVVDGDVVLGVAGVDLVYLRLSSLLCAIDRVQPRGRSHSRSPRRHNRGPRPLRKP